MAVYSTKVGPLMIRQLREASERMLRRTERSVQMIVSDLEGAGYITRERRGRRNHYAVHSAKNFRHPHEADHSVGELLQLFGNGG